MGTLKNLKIAAIVAAISPLINVVGMSNANKTIINEQIAALQSLDDQLALDPNADIAGDLADAQEVIEDLKKQLKEAIDAKEAASNEIVGEVDGVKYLVNHGAAGIGSAEEIARSEDKMRKILAIKGQNVLTKF